MIDDDTKRLLERWDDIKRGEGLKRADKVTTVLRIIGAVTLVLAGIALFNGVYPIPAAIGAAVYGWTTAEANALRSRQKMWPVFDRYIDWKRVQDDLHDPATQS